MGEKPVPVPLCWPQIPHELTWDRKWTSGNWPVTNHLCHCRAKSTRQWRCQQTDSNHHSAHSSYKCNCSKSQCVQYEHNTVCAETCWWQTKHKLQDSCRLKTCSCQGLESKLLSQYVYSAPHQVQIGRWKVCLKSWKV
jgi:hypothetical protein